MVKLNSNLRKTLAIALPFNGVDNIFEEIESRPYVLRGMPAEEFFEYLSELEEMELLRVTSIDDNNDDCRIQFTSTATSYFRDSKIEVAKTICRYLFQLLIGASGGLVVALLSDLL